MTRNNKIATGFIFLLVLISVSFEAYKYIIAQDYFLYLNPPCKQDEGLVCFVYSDDDTGELGDPYLKMYRKAFQVKACLQGGDCDPYICHPDEKDCFLITCDESSLEDGEVCLTDSDHETQ